MNSHTPRISAPALLRISSSSGLRHENEYRGSFALDDHRLVQRGAALCCRGARTTMCT